MAYTRPLPWSAAQDWWDVRLDLSPDLTKVIAGLSPEERDELLEDLARDLAPWTADDGELTLPGRSHVVRADV